MEKFKLIIYRAAQADLEEIVEYVNRLSPDAAFALYDAIIDGIGTLSEMPMRCPVLKTSHLRAKGYRALQVKKYTVFFVVVGDTVQVRRILYSKRQFELIL